MCKKRRGLEAELTKIIRGKYDLDKKYNRDLTKLNSEKKQRQNLFGRSKLRAPSEAGANKLDNPTWAKSNQQPRTEPRI